MDTKFTTKSQEALSAAASNAATAGNPNIEPAHVLKALMDQRDGVAVAVLQATGANADAVSIKASNIIHEMPRRALRRAGADMLPVSRVTRVASGSPPSCPAMARGPSAAVIFSWCCAASTSVGASMAA